MTVAYLVWVRPFLTANWRYLAMLNFVVDPKIVAPLVPPGTELDFENGETFLSVVGFLFLDTRLLGLPIPLHRDFEEVNLRFYVRKKSADTWRRGVVFVRELVPRRAIALVARAFYGEKYLALPMKHEIEHVDPKLKVEYSWRRGCKWESLKMSASGEPQAIAAGSHAEFMDAASIRSNIRAGKFGTPMTLSFAVIPRLFTAHNLSRPCRLRRALPSSPKVRPSLSKVDPFFCSGSR